MKQVTLGRTGLKVCETGFGALPIQRISKEDAAALLRYAREQGVTFFDTARGYTDSEEKIGYAFAGGLRDNIYIATKTMARTRLSALAELETSLSLLGTDHVDLWQLHCLPALPDHGDPESAYAALLEARDAGKTRWIGMTTHRLDVALAAAESGLYDTVQFPLNYLSTPAELKLIEVCRRNNVGLIAMKGMSGGLISSPQAAYAFLSQYENVLPVWGVQKQSELDDFLTAARKNLTLTPELMDAVERDRALLQGGFCRGCGYCEAVCPQGIPIHDAARMKLMLNRAPWQSYTTPEWIEKMKTIETCLHCGQCATRCPYELDTPHLLQHNYRYFMDFCKEKGLL